LTRAADICVSAAACPTNSLSVTPKTASARATSSTGRSSTASWVGAAELRSNQAIWSEQAPFGRHIHAEAAFSVDDGYRRRGIGEKLFKRILRAATNHGVETIEIVCLPENVGMQNLARKFSAHFTFEENWLTGRLTARPPTAFSLIREASGDALDFGAALFDAHWRAVADAREKGA
jgi:GNAT superfamily N-acetyltransferase